MTTRREAILTGVTRAVELHHELGLRDRLCNGDRPVDVIEAAQEVGLLVLFRPLAGLLGAYVPTPRSGGMLVTTRRTLHIQRFTAAHELGHHVLGHKALSLDTEKDIGFVARGELTSHDPQEIEADAFASEFLLPGWLLVAHARRHQWGKNNLTRPEIVYQLSLRLGVSYAATCWALTENNLISRTTAKQLVATPPKASKQQAIPDITPETWHSDVWVFSEHDRGIYVLGNPDDWLVLALKEHVASGYTWDTKGVASAGLNVERDERAEPRDEAMGSAVTRRLVVKGPAKGRLLLEEKRAWDQRQTSLNTFELNLALVGAEPEGLPRAARAVAA